MSVSTTTTATGVKRKRTAGSAQTGPKSKKQRINFANPQAGRSMASIEEKKNIDTVGNATITFGQATGNNLLLNGVGQGTSAITRIGRRITMKSILVRWQGSLAPTTTGTSRLRCLIIYDRQANGALYNAGDLLVADNIGSPNNLGNSRRFLTLMDIEVPCVGTQGPQSWLVTRYRALNLDVEFNAGNAGTIADIQSGSIYAWTYQGGELLIASPTNILNVRIRFTDA